jgi:hypothetical protein
MAGLIGKAEEWAHFADEWRASISKPPRIEHFVMSEAVKLTGQFSRFKAAERDRKVRGLARVIDGYGFTAFHTALELDGFLDTIAVYNENMPFKYPYVTTFTRSILIVALELLDRGQTERFEIFFDENWIFGPKAKAMYYTSAREALRLIDPNVERVIPVEPMFRDDKENMPLQAADMIVWLESRAIANDYQGFDWLEGEFSKTRESEHSEFVDRGRLETISTDSVNYERWFRRLKRLPPMKDEEE